MSTPALAATPVPTPAPAAPTVADLQSQVSTLQAWAQVLKAQRDEILDQLTAAQVQITQIKAAPQPQPQPPAKK